MAPPPKCLRAFSNLRAKFSVVYVTATAAGERVGFDRGIRAWLNHARRLSRDGGGLRKTGIVVSSSTSRIAGAAGNRSLHGDSVAKLEGWRKATCGGALALGGSPPGGLPCRLEAWRHLRHQSRDRRGRLAAHVGGHAGISL